MTCSFQCVGRVGMFVCLDFDDNVIFEGMRDFVAGEEDCGVEEQLAAWMTKSALREIRSQ